MGIKKRLLGAVCTVLAASVLVQPGAVLAAETDSFLSTKLGNRFSLSSLFETVLSSRIVAGTALSEEEAALRLYYLGMISGTSVNANGGVEFALDRGLTRLEAAIFAVRLMGAEEEAENAAYAHPYTDVPDWASAYVGYMYNRGLLNFVGNRQFRPNAAVTCDEFMSYILYALGYRVTDGDYSTIMAATIARRIGICVTEKDEALTRGGACAAMYNALRTTMKNSEKVLSNKLVESGRISYEDAIFLLWSENKEETEFYMSAARYGRQWIIPDGYYTIASAENGKNMAASVAESAISLKEPATDASHSFRLERTERGTYLIYSAASRGGFGNVLGAADGDEGTVGLFDSTSKNAMEYYIEGSVDGTWTIISARDADSALTHTASDGDAITLAKRGEAEGQTWTITRNGVLNSSGEELAIFCCNSLSVTQGAYDTYSHQRQNALDMQPTEGKAFAPFNATIVAINPGDLTCNAVWIESLSPVRYADGTYDYMTVCFMHDNDISDLYVGKGLRQGDWFYDSGVKGIASGSHIHMAVYRGKYNSSMRIGSGDVYAEDAFFLADDTYIRNDYGLDWVVISSAK